MLQPEDITFSNKEKEKEEDIINKKESYKMCEEYWSLNISISAKTSGIVRAENYSLPLVCKQILILIFKILCKN